MKKEWQTPELEVLDIKMTMLSATGTRLDNDFENGTLLEDITLS